MKLPAVDLDEALWGSLYAHGARAFSSTSGALTLIDTSDPGAPAKTRHDVQGWSCSAIEVHGDRAYCALGQYGALSISL